MIPPIARRFVAGETTESALDYVETLNERDVGAILNILGEHYTDPKHASAAAADYCDLITALSNADVSARISIKPSQLGRSIGPSTFENNVTTVIDHAQMHDQFVWMDMEHHTTIDTTLSQFERLTERYPHGIGVCIQANMKRSPADIDRIAGKPGAIRLVKGAYSPPSEIAITDKHQIDTAFTELLETLFRRHDHGIGVATHDPRMIDHAATLDDEYHTPFEFQMLMGVREQAQYDLAHQYDVWQYVPFGTKWASYFYRRLRERKENIFFALRALLQHSSQTRNS